MATTRVPACFINPDLGHKGVCLCAESVLVWAVVLGGGSDGNP
jgi:hypothetical protein